MRAAGEFGAHWFTHLWNASAFAVGAIFSVVEGSRGSKPTSQPNVPELRSVLQSLPEAVFLFDSHCCVIEVNKAAEELSCQSRADLLALDTAALTERIVGPGSGADLKTIVNRALRGELVRHERRILHCAAKGKPIEVRISGSPIYSPSKRISGALIVIEDVSELSGLREQVASGERHFAVGQMTAGLAHDFNNILGTISQAVYVLEMTGGRAESDRNMLGIINNAVRRGAEIVNNIREYLRGRTEAPSRVNMRVLLEEVLQLTEPVLEMHPGINISHDLQDSCEVCASPPELRRVFTNLILNALDAMPQGGTLTIGCRHKEGRVMVSVSDTGAGIPFETQNRIFSPYFTTKAKGTGLGLAGARKAIQAQRGDITFESTPGTGTTFFISLPTITDQELGYPRVA